MFSQKALGHKTVCCVAGVCLAAGLLSAFRSPKKNTTTAITQQTEQPDKIAFDKAMADLRKNQFDTARQVLTDLINTYDSSEYLAKAKLAIGDSWLQEGGAHGLAEAEQEYKDFILFYPTMEEAAQAQYKICGIHYDQLAKADRDSAEAQRAEDECRTVLTQFPNSKYVAPAEQRVRDVQEIIAEKEFMTGTLYYKKQSLPAANGRFAFVAAQYPLFSQADEALWLEADTDRRMGTRFENDEAAALTRIVQYYPISDRVEAARKRLTELKRPIPEADPDAYARMKFNSEHARPGGLITRTMDVITGKPDTGMAARKGNPAMTAIKPGAPVSIPAAAAGSLSPAGVSAELGVSDVAIGVVNDTSNIDRAQDARADRAGSATATATAAAAAAGPSGPSGPAAQVALPTNHPWTKQDIDILRKQQETAIKKYEAYMKKHPQAASGPAAGPSGPAAASGAEPAKTAPAVQ